MTGERAVAGRANRVAEKRNAALVLLGAALVTAAVVLLTLRLGPDPFQDSWEFLMHRRGFSVDAFMQPHNEHIVVLPVAIEQLSAAALRDGLGAPEFVVLTAFLLATRGAGLRLRAPPRSAPGRR